MDVTKIYDNEKIQRGIETQKKKIRKKRNSAQKLNRCTVKQTVNVLPISYQVIYNFLAVVCFL